MYLYSDSFLTINSQQYLSHRFSFLLAGDGNCGYRAFLVGLVEAAFLNTTTQEVLLKRLSKLKKRISSWSFPR